MTWPDTYRERHEVLQRAVGLILQAIGQHPQAVAAASAALADDPEAVVETVDAMGGGDAFIALAEEAKRS